MLENLRDKFYTVQQELSAGLKNLKVGEVSLSRSKSQLFRKKHFSVNFNAGADLLQHYQKQWQEFHNLNDDNAKQAEEVGRLIENLQGQCQEQSSAIQQIVIQLSQVPRLQTSVSTLMNKIGELEGIFEEVEVALFNLEDVIEMQQLQEKQLDQRFQLALHKEKRLAGFDDIKSKLAEDHAVKLLEYEKRQQKLQLEREEAFKEVFEEDMQQYKEFGCIERPPSCNSVRSTLGLEEIQLDEDEEDKEKLNEFLEDVDKDEHIPSEALSNCETENTDENDRY